MLKTLFLLASITFFQSTVYSSNTLKYWIFFKDKPKNNTSQHFCSDFVAEKRMNKQLPLVDEYDLPVNEGYLSILKYNGLNVVYTSKWLNAALVKGDEKKIKKILGLPFILTVEKPSKYKIVHNHENIPESIADQGLEDLLHWQVQSLEGHYFQNQGVDGSGIRIAIFDAGFPGVDKLDAFKHLFENNKIVGTWDFVKGAPNVYDYMEHGTMVLSCIAGMAGDKPMGLAPGAEFLLARTEVWTEKLQEEENWIAAMEWAEANGADIISSSLGYTYHRYFKSGMDGKTSLIARATEIAAKKGILVINAAGNDGDKRWEIINTPADAENVLTVGGIDPATKIHIGFSSYGPTADFRQKPNVAAFGEVVVSNSKLFKRAYGTSFSTPLVAGFAACVWQMYPKMDNYGIFDVVQKSANLYPYFDYAHGFGMPQAGYFFDSVYQAVKDTSFQFILLNNQIMVQVVDSSFENDPFSYLYYKIVNYKGVLRKYAVIRVQEGVPFVLPKNALKENEKLIVHYKNFTNEIKTN